MKPIANYRIIEF